MGLFKNTKKHPKTTKKGVWISLSTIAVGAFAAWMATKNAEFGALILENKEVVGGAIVLLGTIIFERFASKEDKT